MNILSLFDGISCGMVALERAGIPVERYVAYEIEPNAIKTTPAVIAKIKINERTFRKSFNTITPFIFYIHFIKNF